MTETDEDLNYQRIGWYVVLEHDLMYVTIPNETEDNDEIQRSQAGRYGSMEK